MSEEGTPDFPAPPLSCDSHFHVFGPADRYPHGSDLRYPPPLTPLGDYAALAQRLGLERMVFVQPSAYGRDNRCMLDAMREVGPARCRGIVDIDEATPESELDQLHSIGVRGVRINVTPVKPPEPGFFRTMIPRIERLDERLAARGWQLDFLTPGWLTTELMPVFRRLKVPFTLAHMGMYLAQDGAEQSGFRALIELLNAGERRCWVKLTGTYRMSTAPDFADVDAMARALLRAAPDRLIWGSDYPHLSFADRVGSIELFNLLGRWTNARERQQILVENPARLFGF